MSLSLDALTDQLRQVQQRAQAAAVQQVNYWLTARNWLIGYYLREYEQQGRDRAAYGECLLGEVAQRLRQRGAAGLSTTTLKLCRQFYQTYPALLAGQPQVMQQLGLAAPAAIGQAASDQLPALPGLAPDLLLGRLSFSHFIKLLKLDSITQRAFYEVQAVKNSWPVRELKRAIDSLLYERTGLSTNKAAVLAAHAGTGPPAAADVVRNPYVLEFLGLEQRPE